HFRPRTKSPDTSGHLRRKPKHEIRSPKLPLPAAGPVLVPKLCLGTRSRETPFPGCCCLRETEFPGRAFPNGVWERGKDPLVQGAGFHVLCWRVSSGRRRRNKKASSGLQRRRGVRRSTILSLPAGPGGS